MRTATPFSLTFNIYSISAPAMPGTCRDNRVPGVNIYGAYTCATAAVGIIRHAHMMRLIRIRIDFGDNRGLIVIVNNQC